MRKLGILSLTLLAALSLGTDAFAQRGGGGGGGRSSGGGGGGSSAARGSGGSQGSSGMSRAGSTGGSSSRASSGGGSSSRPSGPSAAPSRGHDSSPSTSGRSSSSYGSSSRSSGDSPRSYGYDGSRSSGGRTYEPAPRYDDDGRSLGRGGSSAPEALSPRSSAIVNRYTSAPRSSDPIDLGAGQDRVRFPAPYRSGVTAGRPAVPSTWSGRGNTSPELVRMVDRYRGAANGKSSVSPIADRYGRSGSGDERAAGPGRGAPSLGLDSERYARGPRLRRTPSGSSVTRAAGVAPGQRTDRQIQGDGLARPSSGGGHSASRAGDAEARQREVSALRGVRRLAERDPQAARRIQGAGRALADAASAGVAAGVGAISGPAAAAAVRGATLPGDSSKLKTCFDSCWDDCNDFWFGFSFSFGCGWGSCWPFWGCGWWPFYWYGHYYPYYYPYYYYPYYYTTVVYDSYGGGYGGGGDVIVYADGDDDYAEPAPAEPVGEAAAQRAPDSPLRTSLSIAAERYLTLGDSAFREGRFGDAAQFYAKAAEYAPEEGVFHLVLADALFATGDYHYAAYAIRRAFELDPTLVEAIVDKHEFYADPADFDRHIARAELFLRENPEDSDARLVLAANYLFGNRPASAVDLLETASALSLRADTAATAILAAARAVQHGEPAEKP